MSTFVQAAWLDIEHPLDLKEPRAELGGVSLRALAALTFDQLGQFKAAGLFPPGYPADVAKFYSPRDPGVHAVEAWVAMQVTHSWECNMYGEDDPLIASITRMHCDNPLVLTVVNLDSSEFGGKHEQEIMGLFRAGENGNSVAAGQIGQQIAVGRSILSAISHLKINIADRRVMSGGSTNQSQSGEERQDNELTVTTNPMLAGEASTVVGLNHVAMLAQMAKKAAAA